MHLYITSLSFPGFHLTLFAVSVAARNTGTDTDRAVRPAMDGTIVSCEWLKERLDENALPNDVIIIDVSWASTRDVEEEYNE